MALNVKMSRMKVKVIMKSIIIQFGAFPWERNQKQGLGRGDSLEESCLTLTLSVLIGGGRTTPPRQNKY